MSPSELWRFLPFGYLLTIAIETPILLVGLSSRHPKSRRLLSGIWLTACTYPIVVIVLPLLLANYSRAMFLAVAETFAPVMECLLFWLAFGTPDDLGRRSMWRDFAAIVIANLASFLIGELLNAWNWFGLLDQLR
ncbi:MAG TPA: hypothetical protein VFZ22_14720 [Pyrinomonadaceae bacterium]|nr:hypothetical protein [Pyrinomonadaceae bacterium]